MYLQFYINDNGDKVYTTKVFPSLVNFFFCHANISSWALWYIDSVLNLSPNSCRTRLLAVCCLCTRVTCPSYDFSQSRLSIFWCIVCLGWLKLVFCKFAQKMVSILVFFLVNIERYWRSLKYTLKSGFW